MFLCYSKNFNILCILKCLKWNSRLYHLNHICPTCSPLNKIVSLFFGGYFFVHLNARSISTANFGGYFFKYFPSVIILFHLCPIQNTVISHLDSPCKLPIRLCVSLCFRGILTSQQISLLILHQMMPNNSNVIMQLRSHFRCLYNLNGFANCPLQFSDLTSYSFLFPSFSQSYQLSFPCRILH